MIMAGTPTPRADTFLLQPENAAAVVALDGIPLAEKQRLKGRLNTALQSIIRGTNHVNFQGVWRNTPILTEQDALNDVLNQVAFFRTAYHGPGHCEANFDDLAVALSTLLAAGRYQDALTQLADCIRLREDADRVHPTRPSDLGHATAIALLRSLQADLVAINGALNKQVTLYQYITRVGEQRIANGPETLQTLTGGKTVYNIRVDDIVPGAPLVHIDRPYTVGTPAEQDAAAAAYDAIKLERIRDDPGYIAAVNRRDAAAVPVVPAGPAGPGGRRTRRRRAFKRRSKQSRRRVSRRA